LGFLNAEFIFGKINAETSQYDTLTLLGLGEPLLDERLGIYEVNNPYAPIEVRGNEEIILAEKIIEGWEEVKNR
jgi:hypothetical protein